VAETECIEKPTVQAGVLPLALLLEGLVNCSAKSSAALLSPGVPSTASLINDMVVSILLLRVLGLVIVVPQLAVLP
jgi:hypothetical protein